MINVTYNILRKQKNRSKVHCVKNQKSITKINAEHIIPEKKFGKNKYIK